VRILRIVDMTLAEDPLPSRRDVSRVIRERIIYLQGTLDSLQQGALKAHADEFSAEWAAKKNLEHTITPMQDLIRQLKTYQGDVENEDIRWELERVEALAKEFFRQSKAASHGVWCDRFHDPLR
jgi:hypothetical protein